MQARGNSGEAPAERASWAGALWLAGFSAVLLIVLLPFSAYVASVPFIRQEWGMTNAQSGLVFSAYLAGYALSSLVLLPLTDRVSPQRVLLVAVAFMTLANLLFPLLARDVWTGSLLRLLAGGGYVGVYIPGVQIVSLRYARRRRGTAVSVFVGAGYAGTTLSYVFMGFLLDRTGSWRTAYLITALVGLAALLLAYGLTRGGGDRETRAPGPARRGLLDVGVLRDPSVALVILAYALHTAELYLARLWLPLLLGAALVTLGRDPLGAASLAASLAGLMFMTGVVGVFLGGVLSDWVGRTRGAVLIFAVSGACSFAIGWLVGAPLWALVALGFLYGFATAADSAIYSTAVTELSPPGRIGSTQAVQSFVGFGVGAVAPVVAGSILDLADSATGWGLAFGFNGLLAVVGVAALLLLRSLPGATRMAGGRG